MPFSNSHRLCSSLAGGKQWEIRIEGWGQIIEDISLYLEMDGFDGSGDCGYDL